MKIKWFVISLFTLISNSTNINNGLGKGKGFALLKIQVFQSHKKKFRLACITSISFYYFMCDV